MSVRGFYFLSLMASSTFLLLCACGSSNNNPPPAQGINGCAATSFPASSAADAGGNVVVMFGSPLGLVYSPACTTINAGQTLTFQGASAPATFSVHPLTPGGANGTSGGSSGNPIVAQATGSTYTVSFPAKGTFGYFCQVHQGSGMAGAVLVK